MEIRCYDCQHQYQLDCNTLVVFSFDNEFFNSARFICPLAEFKGCRTVGVFLIDIPHAYLEPIWSVGTQIALPEPPFELKERFRTAYGFLPGEELREPDEVLLAAWKDDLDRADLIEQLLIGPVQGTTD